MSAPATGPVGGVGLCEPDASGATRFQVALNLEGGGEPGEVVLTVEDVLELIWSVVMVGIEADPGLPGQLMDEINRAVRDDARAAAETSE